MIKFLTRLFLFFILSFFFLKEAEASVIENPSYYSSAASIPTNFQNTCPVSCGNLNQYCWNSEAPYQTNCGVACKPGDNTPNTWTKYAFDVSTCRKDQDQSDLLGDIVCKPIYVISDRTCSTGDKDNNNNYSNPAVNGTGDLSILRAGFCDCTVGGGYKTCCSAGNAVSANSFAVDPYDPLEGGCGNNTIAFCGGAGQPACGQAACATPTPTPAGCKTDAASAVGCKVGCAVVNGVNMKCHVENRLNSTNQCSSACPGAWNCVLDPACPNNASPTCTPGQTETICSGVCTL